MGVKTKPPRINKASRGGPRLLRPTRLSSRHCEFAKRRRRLARDVPRRDRHCDLPENSYFRIGICSWHPRHFSRTSAVPKLARCRTTLWITAREIARLSPSGQHNRCHSLKGSNSLSRARHRLACPDAGADCGREKAHSNSVMSATATPDITPTCQ